MYTLINKYMSVFILALFLSGYVSDPCIAQETTGVEVGEATSMADVPSPYVRDFNLHMKGNPQYNICVLNCYNGTTSCRCGSCSKTCNGEIKDFGSGPQSTYNPLSPEETATCMNSKCADRRRCADDCAKNHPVINTSDPSPFDDYDKFTLYGDPYVNNDVNHCWRWAQECRWNNCRDKAGQDLSGCMEQKCKQGYDRCFSDRSRIKDIQ